MSSRACVSAYLWCWGFFYSPNLMQEITSVDFSRKRWLNPGIKLVKNLLKQRRKTLNCALSPLSLQQQLASKKIELLLFDAYDQHIPVPEIVKRENKISGENAGMYSSLWWLEPIFYVFMFLWKAFGGLTLADLTGHGYPNWVGRKCMNSLALLVQTLKNPFITVVFYQGLCRGAICGKTGTP